MVKVVSDYAVTEHLWSLKGKYTGETMELNSSTADQRLYAILNTICKNVTSW